ncbi:MAG: hypothetical protein J6Q74_01550 [Clostridia bacterium]|nr:hypothetical protein [Clostridia bacterium]
MLLFTVEESSGFIKHEYAPSAALIIAFLLIAAALVVYSATVNKGIGYKVGVSPYIFGVVEVITAIAIFYEAFLSSLLDYATPLQMAFNKATALLSIISLLYIAYCTVKGVNAIKIVVVMPIIFWITRVITIFTEFASLASVTDTLIETASMCLCLGVFLDFAKSECQMPIKNIKISRAVAALCGYVCAVGSVPRFICGVINPSGFEYFANIPALTSFAAALFSICFALKLKEE